MLALHNNDIISTSRSVALTQIVTTSFQRITCQRLHFDIILIMIVIYSDFANVIFTYGYTIIEEIVENVRFDPS